MALICFSLFLVRISLKKFQSTSCVVNLSLQTERQLVTVVYPSKYGSLKILIFGYVGFIRWFNDLLALSESVWLATTHQDFLELYGIALFVSYLTAYLVNIISM